MNYVEEAQKNIQSLYVDSTDRNNSGKITTSQIRGLLSSMSDIYNDVVQLESDELTDDLISRIMYLKVQFIYTSGRANNKNVKVFITKTGIIEKIDKIGKSKKKFIEVERYMEALVAYHKFYGGKEE